MDAEKVVAEYQALTAPQGAAAGRGEDGAQGRGGGGRGAGTAAVMGAGSKAAGPKPAAGGGHGWLAVVIAVLVIAGIVYWGQTGKSEKAAVPGAGHGAGRRAASVERGPGAAENRVPRTARQQQAAGAAARRRAAAAAAPVPGAAARPRPAAALPVAPAGQIEVAIAAAAPAWIHLSAAGKTVAEMTLGPGNTVSYAVTPPVDLITGNAGATQVTVNGAAQPALGAAGAVVLWRYPPGAVQALPAAKPAGTPAAPPNAVPGAPKAPVQPAAARSPASPQAKAASTPGGQPRGKEALRPAGTATGESGPPHGGRRA